MKLIKIIKPYNIYECMFCHTLYMSKEELKTTKCSCKSLKRLKNVLNKMKERCYDEKFIYYKNYGGRGITICDEWLEDRNKFYDWAIENGYSDELQIDRIDNDKGYSPDNCRFVTAKENSNNRRKKYGRNI